MDGSGSFIISPQSYDLTLSRITYSVGDLQIFDFNLGMSQFFITSGLADTNKGNFNKKLYSGYYLSNGFKLQTRLPISFEQDAGPCNITDEKYSFDGLVCRNQKKTLQFSPKYGGTTRLEGFLKSAANSMTFETWFKFSGPIF
jgi:hypothetical protein